MCYIDATGGIDIGDNVSIAHGTTIMSTTHRYDDLKIPIKDQPVDVFPTLIENNVWIGAKATILAGNIIGTGSIIAANAVITMNVPSMVVVGGVPAKIIKKRV
jgi:acetyltransferase-like isoleucine patch superfamily enzyme